MKNSNVFNGKETKVENESMLKISMLSESMREGGGGERGGEREKAPSQLCIHSWKRYNAHEGGGRSQ